MEADDLHVAEVVTWRNDKTRRGDRLPKEPIVCFDHNRYYNQMAGASVRSGHRIAAVQSPAPLKLPATEGEYPPIVKLLLDARGKGNLWVDVSRPFWWDLPMLVATGQVDSIEVAHGQMCRETVISSEKGGRPRDRVRYPDPWGNAQWSMYIYFQLLECGLRIPPSAGSGVGRVAQPGGLQPRLRPRRRRFHLREVVARISRRPGVVTNGPLLKPLANGELPGHVFQADKGAKLDFEISLTLWTREPVSYLEIIKNGKVEHSVPFAQYSKTASCRCSISTAADGSWSAR